MSSGNDFNILYSNEMLKMFALHSIKKTLIETTETIGLDDTNVPTRCHNDECGTGLSVTRGTFGQKERRPKIVNNVGINVMAPINTITIVVVNTGAKF